MPPPNFRGDPYRVLEVATDASEATIKRRWRQLAREHHPDRASGSAEDTSRLTRRMARINAAYDLLRDPQRRARYDAAAGGRGTRNERPGGRTNGRASFDTNGRRRDAQAGPPPPPPSRPVTGRFDASAIYHRRNCVTSDGGSPLRGQRPMSSREFGAPPEPLRASKPNGPIRSRQTGRRPEMPTLEEAIASPLEFGKFRGHTLGEVAAFEPTYIDWIAGTITRDRDLVVRALVVQAELDRLGVQRKARPPTPGFGTDIGPEPADDA